MQFFKYPCNFNSELQHYVLYVEQMTFGRNDPRYFLEPHKVSELAIGEPQPGKNRLLLSTILLIGVQLLDE